MSIPTHRETPRPSPLGDAAAAEPTVMTEARVQDIDVEFATNSIEMTLQLSRGDSVREFDDAGTPYLTINYKGRAMTVNLSHAYWWSVGPERTILVPEMPYEPPRV